MKKIDVYRAERNERSRSAWFITAIIMALALAACASTAASPTPIPTLVLDNNSLSSNNNQSSDGNAISAAAVVVPVKEARLAFSTVGRVTSTNVKVGDKVTAGQTLVELDTTLQEARVREAEANLLAAQVQFNYQKRLGVDEVHIQTAEAEIARTQALLDSANAMLASQFTLTAPFNGTIVSVDVAPAETVVPGQVVIVLGDLSRYQIETTDLSERDVPRVQVGQSASLFIEALNEEFTGRVIDIDRIGSTLGGDVVYTVTLAFDRQPQGLLWGMSADVELQAAE